ncbi:MAG: PAQR family membrane homeostasis protein TrhA [Rubripirellula sp.]
MSATIESQTIDPRVIEPCVIDPQVMGSALRTRGEEFDAAFTHGIGTFAAAVGGAYLLAESLANRDLLSTLGCLLYVSALLGVLGCSTLSHLYLPDHLNRRFRAYDQGFIYLLAAGSLSPFALTYLRTPFWMTFYTLSVALAFAGFFSKVLFTHRVDKISLWFYLVLGWGQAIALIPLLAILPSAAVTWIIAGAACYSIGVVFLVLDLRRYHFHAIWHLFVLAACGCHYYAILRYVVHGAA